VSQLELRLTQCEVRLEAVISLLPRGDGAPLYFILSSLFDPEPKHVEVFFPSHQPVVLHIVAAGSFWRRVSLLSIFL